MAKKHKEENVETMIETFSKSEKFFKKNGKALIATLIVLLLAAAGGFIYYQFMYLPEVEEATDKTAVAEYYFGMGDYETALQGDGEELGFYGIIDEYGSKAPASVYLYAGICELQLQNWELAIKNLEQYEGEEPILQARAVACIGHAQVGLENYEAALASFEKAANMADNNFAADYLLNAGLVAEKLGQNDKALACYEKIKDMYFQSLVAQDIDKYIGRIQNK